MTKITMTMTFFMIHFQNVADDDIQTLDNIYDRIANGHSWSIITPYLEVYLPKILSHYVWIERRGEIHLW